MKANTQTYLLADARKALSEHRLLSALESLRGAANSIKAWGEAETVTSLSESYRMLLEYLSKGIDDPERHKMYANFVRRAYDMCDVLEREVLLTDNVSFFASTYHTMQSLGYASCSLSHLLAKQVSPRVLFDAVWTSPQFSSDDEIAFGNFLSDEQTDNDTKCLVLSALALSGILFFDVAKYRLLLDNVLTSDTKLRVRAMVGLLFVHIIHSARLSHYPDVAARLRLMADVPGFKRELELLQTQLFLSLETKRIEQNLRDEIIPRMMERMKNLRIDRSLGLDELKDKLSEVDLNPEWDDDGKASKLHTYMQEFVELQQRGADMYMGSFKMLKQRFPFFSVAANWFWPFSYNHPEVPAAARENPTLRLILSNAGLCDSDKYSFSLMADHLPPMGMDDLKQQMSEQFGEFDDNVFSRGKSEVPDFKSELRSYVQGVYRFCNLYIHRETFPNPFQRNLFIVDYAPFDALLDDREFLVRMAEFVFKDKSYSVAKTLLQRLPFEKLSAGLYQKLGYCFEQEGDYEQAAASFRQANALKPHSAWTLRRMAVCLRELGNHEGALAAYDELADIYPDNAMIALRQAECYIRLKEYDNAFKFLFKSDYLSPDSGHATRAIAWCSLLTGKYEQAEKYYQKVLCAAPTPTDWLNAGHTALLSGRLPQAVNRYLKCLPAESPESFLNEDKAMLLKAGLTENDLAVITDAVILRHQ